MFTVLRGFTVVPLPVQGFCSTDGLNALMKIFVPFSEDLLAETGFTMGDLVPFNLEYRCLRLQEWESVEIIEPEDTPAGELRPA